MDDFTAELLRNAYAKKYGTNKDTTTEELDHISKGENKNSLKRFAGMGAGMSGASLASNAYRSGEIDGTKKMLHRTSKGNVASILENGIVAKAEPGELTRNGLAMDLASGNVDVKDLANKTYATNGRVHDLGVAQGRIINGLDSGKSLKVNMPLNEVNKRSVANPELMGAKNKKEFLAKKTDSVKKFKEMGGFSFADPDSRTFKSQTKGAFDTLGPKGTTVLEGSIDPKYIKGSKTYQKQTAKSVAEHVKKNPAMFAKGSAKALAGLGLAGLGVKAFYDGTRKVDTSQFKEKEANNRYLDIIEKIALEY